MQTNFYEITKSPVMTILLSQLTCELCVLYRQSNIFKRTQKRFYTQISFDQIFHVGKNIFHVLYDWPLVLTVPDILESRI